MSYPDLPPLPKSLAAAVLPEGSSWAYVDTPSTSSSARNLPPQDPLDGPNICGSLSSTADSVSSGEASKSPTVSSPGTTSNESNMDTQLATLRQEMHNLRQMDLSLLTQLWALNESIQGFRARLEDRKSSRSPSPKKSVGSESENEFKSISSGPSNEPISSSYPYLTQGTRGIRSSLVSAKPRGDIPLSSMKTNNFQEKLSRKSRQNKNLYDYPCEEKYLSPEPKYKESTVSSRTRNTNSISQRSYSNKDLIHYPISNTQSLQSTDVVAIRQHSMEKQPRQAHLNHNELCVQWVPPANSHPKTSKGAIPKILSILQRKQRAPPPPPPFQQKSPQRPV